MALRPTRLSVTRIETLRRDPYAIFAAHVLRIAPLPQIASGIDFSELGSRMHDALHAFASAREAQGSTQARRGKLLAILEDEFAHALRDPSFRAFRWTSLQKAADLFLGFDADRRALAREITTETTGKLDLLLADGTPFVLSARADRIDFNRDGSALLVDYKTGQPPGLNEVKVGFAPQLTLEAAILRGGGFGRSHPGAIAATYVKLGGRDGGRLVPLNFKDDFVRRRGRAPFRRGAAAALGVPQPGDRISVAPLPKIRQGLRRLRPSRPRARMVARRGGGGLSALVIPEHLTARQHSASDPTSSIWVSANAGSGKTHVLTQRVMRLLLMGVQPSKILCLTFTKAAAAEMSARVFRELSKWTALEDGALREKILETGAPYPDAQGLVRARRLFTRTVETPGGLKIQTIHAFCERLLHLFPFEANVPARFEVADEKRTEEMLSLAKSAAIAAAQRFEGRPAEALATLAEAAGSLGLDPVLGVAMRLRKAARQARPDQRAALARRLGAGNLTSAAEVRRLMVEDGVAPIGWSELSDILAAGSARDNDQAGRLRRAAAAKESGAAPEDILDAYLAVFFDSKDLPRKDLMTKRLREAHPSVEGALREEQARLVGLREQLKTAETIERTDALVTIVDDIVARYDSAKSASGLLDFDDLIDRTRVLLERSDAGWVLHKLDSGIDHVLVDEAQDTSEAQWTILEKLTDDFASGAGARPASRSFFVVGDEKQSIFSFQGAAPLMFDAMRSDFERRFKQGGLPFSRVALNASFRSTPGILDAVDTVFKLDTHRDGLVAVHDDWTPHESLKPALPSLVEIWPPLGASPKPAPEDWTIPLDLESETDPASQVADRVARKIKLLTAPASGEHVRDANGQPREISPGDILVLVRTRNSFFEAVIRALKAHGVPVAGADRLDVANHIAVMDLVAAGRAALLPQDDLSLACVLKSPLFGFTDDDLLMLAPLRKGPLVAALAASLEPRHKEAHQTIARWSERAAGATPFAFYVELLGRDGGRLKMESRLGPEAHDAIDEFLRLALEHEAAAAPSLTSFLADVEALESSIKRDMEGPRRFRPRDDRACREGAGGEDRLPARHLRDSDRAARPTRLRSRRGRRSAAPRLVAARRRRSRAGRRRAQAAARGGDARVPPAPLRRDDPRRRAALSRRLLQRPEAAGGLLERDDPGRVRHGRGSAGLLGRGGNRPPYPHARHARRRRGARARCTSRGASRRRRRG